MVTLPPSVDEEELKVIAFESLIVILLIIVILFLGVCGPPWFFPIFGFSMLISCVPVFIRVPSLAFLVCAHEFRSLHQRTYMSQPIETGNNPNILY